MKKYLFLLALCLPMMFIASCSKDDDTPVKPDPIKPDPIKPDPVNPTDTTINGMFYQYTDIDTLNYVYPAKGATTNPNIVKYDIEKDEVVSLDTVQKNAVVKFASKAPKLYRGAIVPVIYGEEAYALFVLEAQVNGNVATIHYRDASISEMFFNQTLHFGNSNNLNTRSTAKDKDGKIMTALKLLSMVETGLKVKLDDVDLNFNDTQFDLTLGDFSLFFGRSVNCPFKRLTAVLGGEVSAAGSFSLEPSFKPSYSKCWDIKQMAFCFHKVFVIPTTPPIPVDMDFDIDICGDLSFTGEIKKAFHYAQNIGAKLKVKIGSEYDFEKNTLIPLNSLDFEPVEAKPEIRALERDIHFKLDAAVFPRVKLYFYHFRWAGWGFDIKPVFARLAFNSCEKRGVLFYDVTFSLGSSFKVFMYAWNFVDRHNIYLAESPQLEKVWWSWKAPGDIKDKTKENCERLNYGGESQCTFNVVDLAYEWNEQSCVPAAAEETSIEVEKFGTVPDPKTNPEFYNNTRAPQASADGWYSYGIEYYKIDKNGDVDVPFKVETPSSENFKLVARILNGNGGIIKEVEHPTRAGIKSYVIYQKAGDINYVVTVKDYGNYVHEATTISKGGETITGSVTYSNGKISGTLTAAGHSTPTNSFMGAGNLHCKIVGADGKGWTQSESLDYGRWAHDKLGRSTEGMSFVNTSWRDMPATRASIPEGSFTYIGNCMLTVESSDGSITTEKLEILED